MFFNYIMVSKFYLAAVWVKFDITYLVHLFEGDLACARDLRNLGLAKPAHIRNKRTVGHLQTGTPAQMPGHPDRYTVLANYSRK